MTDLKVFEIEQLRLEAERDLDALRRVESMLKRRRNDSVVNSDVTNASTDNRQKGPKNFGVKARIGEILIGVGHDAMRPIDIVNVIESEFDFADRKNAAAAVSAALSRFKVAGNVIKLNNGRYVWKKDDSAD